MSNEHDFYMIWSEQSNLTRHRHRDLDQAKTEAQRLAASNPGCKFYVLHAKGYAELPKPAASWRELGEIPF